MARIETFFLKVIKFINPYLVPTTNYIIFAWYYLVDIAAGAFVDPKKGGQVPGFILLLNPLFKGHILNKETF